MSGGGSSAVGGGTGGRDRRERATRIGGWVRGTFVLGGGVVVAVFLGFLTYFTLEGLVSAVGVSGDVTTFAVDGVYDAGQATAYLSLPLGVIVGLFVAAIREPRGYSVGVPAGLGVAVVTVGVVAVGVVLEVATPATPGSSPGFRLAEALGNAIRGTIAGGLVTVTGAGAAELVSGVWSSRGPQDSRRIGGIPSAAFGLGLMAALGIAGGVVVVLETRTLVAVGVVANLPPIPSMISEWNVSQFPTVIGAVGVGLVVGTLDRRVGPGVLAAVGAGVAYLVLLGATIVTLVRFAEVPSPVVEQVLDYGRIGARALQVVVVGVGVAAVVTRVRAASVSDRNAPLRSRETPDRHARSSVVRAVVLSAGVVLAIAVAVVLSEGFLGALGSSDAGNPVRVALNGLRRFGPGMGAGLGILLALDPGRYRRRRRAVRAAVGAGTGYLFVAVGTALALTVDGAGADRVIPRLVLTVPPAVGVALAAGGATLVTAAFVGVDR